MINTGLPYDVIYEILSFLNQKDTMNYDTSICNRKFRPIFLDVLKNRIFRYINSCRWSILRQVGGVCEHCNINNLEHISNRCKNVVIYGRKTIISWPKRIFNIINNNIIRLHIDFSMIYNTRITGIQCSNLINLVFVGVRDIDPDVLYNIKYTCPKLKNVVAINSVIESEGTFIRDGIVFKISRNV
jgi:hypothetical protein